MARAPERYLPDAGANSDTSIRAKVWGPDALVFHVPQQRMTTQLRREPPLSRRSAHASPEDEMPYLKEKQEAGVCVEQRRPKDGGRLGC